MENMGFLIRPKHKDKNSFYLIEETWNSVKKKMDQKNVKLIAWAALGFRHDMTTQEARDRASQINKQNQIDSKKITAIAKRIDDDKIIISAYLPENLTNGFENELREDYADNEERLNNLLKQWVIVKKIISELAIDTQKFHDEKQKFYNYYKNKKWSPDYIKKLNRLINLYGQYVGRKTNQFYQDIPRISNVLKERIMELREGEIGLKSAADPLLWKDLKNVKTKFENRHLLEQWNWLFISLWFGLRPKEVDSLANTKTWRVEYDKDHKVKVLYVYQSKLVSVQKDKRWKPIPIYFEEQREAFKLILSGRFNRPLNKTLKNIFNTKIESYSCRKGFTDLMLDKGFQLEDISIFLGHADISMTWKHYKNKKRFKLPA